MQAPDFSDPSTVWSPSQPPSAAALTGQAVTPTGRDDTVDWQSREIALAAALRDSLLALTSSPGVDAVMEQILDSVASVAPYDAATIMLFEEGQARIAYARGFSPEVINEVKGHLIPLTKTHFVNMIHSGQAYLVEDALHDPDWIEVPGTQWIRSSIGAPIILEDQVLGLIAIDSGTPGHFTASDVARVQLFSRYAALALRNAFQNELLMKLVAQRTAELEQAKTALELRESLLRSAQRIAHLGSWVFDPVTQRVEWSEELYRIAGLEPAAEPPALQFLQEMVIPEQREQIFELIQRLEHLQEPIDTEFIFRRRTDGALRHVLVRAEPAPRADAAPYLVGIALDITEHRQAEEALRAALEREQELNLMKSRFVAMAVHEFRNPLSVILAHVELLQQIWHRQPPEMVDRRLAMIQAQVIGLNEIVGSLLEFSRVQSGAIAFQPERLDFADLCNDLIRQLQFAPSDAPSICYDPPPTPVWVQGDPLLLRRVIYNIVANARKYTLNATPVEVELTATDAGVQLRVTDHGIGIEPSDLRQIFEPFHRGANVRDIPGTGLGMAIVKQLVDLHQGHIHIESEVGAGTTVTLELPVTSTASSAS
jgi:PAS domain S-box-containing protein